MKIFIKLMSLVVMVMLSMGYSIAQQYCTSASTNGDWEYISSVQLESINNQSNSGLYQDFTTSLKATLYIGESYALTIKTEKYASTDRLDLFIDWNGDKIFTSNEKISVSYTGVESKQGTATCTLVVPATATQATYRMSSRSQTYLSESFDGATFPPTSWTQTQVTGTGLWARSTSGFNPATTPHSGAGMAFFNCYSFSSGTSASLFTPNIDLSGASGVAVEFWMNRDAGYPTYSDNVEVLINTASSITGATSLGVINRCKTLTPVETGADGWYKYSFIIPSSFNTATNFLIFRANGLYGNCIYVDDIKVYKPLANDIQVKSVTTTPSVLSDGAAAILTATLVNQGSDAQSNVIVTFMSGKLILSAKYEGRVDVSAIPSGSYLVRIATQYGFVLRKVQIVR